MKTIVIEYFDDKIDTISNNIVHRLQNKYSDSFYSFGSDYKGNNSLLHVKKVDSLKKEELINFMLNLNTDENDVYLHFLGHGHQKGYAKSTIESLVNWVDLINIFSQIRTKNLLCVNMLGVCHSANAIPYIDKSAKIDKYWGIEGETNAMSKSDLIYNFNDFESFITNIEDDDERDKMKEFKS